MSKANYGPDFVAAREHFKYLRSIGTVLVCRRCNEPIRPGQPMDCGHPDPEIGTKFYGPEHASCNRSAGITAENRERPLRGHPLAL